MQRRIAITILLTLALLTSSLLSPGMLVFAQGAASNSERILLLREEIKKREAADVPGDLRDLNRARLMERRAELRTLLGIEIDNLGKYRSNLGALITREESQKIDDSIRAYQAEIRKLGDAMQADLASETAAEPTASPAVEMALNATRPDSPPGLNGPTALGSLPSPTPISTASPTSMATPPPAAMPTPNPMPTPALAIEEAQANSAVLDCKAVRDPQNSKVYSELDKQICSMGKDILARRTANAPPRILLRPEAFKIVKILIAKKYTPEYLVEAEEARLDKQVGGAPSNAGSTSLVVKGGAPAILGFAVENGALTKNVNGTAITFRGNPVGIINALANKGFVTSAKTDQEDPILRFLKRTSFAFTFNTDRGSQPGVFTATKQQLSSVSARIEFINKRRAELYIKDWEDFLANNAQPLTNAINQFPFIDTQFTDESVFPFGKWLDPALQAWFVKTQQALAEASETEVDVVIQERLNKLPIKELSPDTVAHLERIEKLMGLYSTGRNSLLKKINGGTIVTFEYLNKREVNAPDTSNFTFIAEKGTKGGGVDFTLNASLTMFNSMAGLRNFVLLNPTLPQPRRLRDFQFAGQVDVPFGDVRNFGQFVLFASGRYERLLENATTDLGVILPNTKGDIGFLQMGLKVPLKGTGFKIPFSVTFANRSELVKEKHVRGNIGFTLDLDTLFAKLKPF